MDPRIGAKVRRERGFGGRPVAITCCTPHPPGAAATAIAAWRECRIGGSAPATSGRRRRPTSGPSARPPASPNSGTPATAAASELGTQRIGG